MTTLELRGRITQNGDLEVELPAGLPSGEVTVRIDLPENDPDWETRPWTDEEIEHLMSQKPMPMADFLVWLDANPPTEPWGDIRDDEDAGDYVHRMRRQSTVTLDEPEDFE